MNSRKSRQDDLSSDSSEELLPPSSKSGSNSKKKGKPKGNATLDMLWKNPPAKPKKAGAPRQAIDPLTFFKTQTKPAGSRPTQSKSVPPPTKKLEADKEEIKEKEKIPLYERSAMAAPRSARKDTASEKKKTPKIANLISSSDSEEQKEPRSPSVPPPRTVPKAKTKARTSRSTSPSPRGDLIGNGSGPMSGFTVVITGLFEVADRKDVEKFLKNLGAKVTSGVSSRTSFLVAGTRLEIGNRPVSTTNKYKKAVEMGLSILTEEKLEKRLQEILDNPQFELASCLAPARAPKEVRAVPGLPPKKQKKATATSMAMEEETKEKPRAERKQDWALWVDKYKPQTSEDLVGNRGTIQSLKEWLRDWNQVHVEGVKKVPRGGGAAAFKINCKAALLSGPPGIGKTSAAMIISRELGFDVSVTNASEKRNKASVESGIKAAAQNNALEGYWGATEAKFKKQVVVMDEVDGMGGSDRGGIAALIQVIKNSKTPIICICNDRQHQKIRSLGDHCYDLPFIRPQKQQIVKRVQQILRLEGATPPQDLEELVESSGNDVRQIINALQFSAASPQGQKDTKVMLSGNSAAAKIMNYHDSSLSTKDRLDMFFVDYDLIPLLVADNYHRLYEPGSVKDMEALAKAAESISFSEEISHKIRSEQQWQLLPQYGVASALTPVGLKGISGHPAQGHAPYPGFPQMYGKMSKMSKHKRLITELRQAMRTSMPHMDVVHYAIPVMLDSVLEATTPEEAVEALEGFGITMDQFKEHVLELDFSGTGKAKFEARAAQEKRKLTALYNKRHQQNFKMPRGKKAAAELDEGQEGGEQASGSEDSQSDAEIKITKTAPKTKKKAVSKKGAKKGGAKKATTGKKRKASSDDDEFDLF